MDSVRDTGKLSHLRWNENTLDTFYARDISILKSRSIKYKYDNNFSDGLEDIGELERRSLTIPEVELNKTREIHAIAGSDVQVYFIRDARVFRSPQAQFLMIKMNDSTNSFNISEPKSFSLHYGSWTHELIPGKSQIYLSLRRDAYFFLFRENELKSTILILPSYQGEPFKKIILELLSVIAFPKIPIDSDFRKILKIHERTLQPEQDGFMLEITNQTNRMKIPIKLELDTKRVKTSNTHQANVYVFNENATRFTPCFRTVTVLGDSNASETSIRVINHGDYINEVTVTFKNTQNLGMSVIGDLASTGIVAHRQRLISTL